MPRMPWAMRPAGSPSGTPMTAACSTHSALRRTNASPASSTSAAPPSRRQTASGRCLQASARGTRDAHDPEKCAAVFGQDHAPSRHEEVMFYEPDKRDKAVLPHDPFKAIVAPRPIGWITSISLKNEVNLAPYSFFNGVNSRPNLVMFGSEGFKDSVANI